MMLEIVVSLIAVAALSTAILAFVLGISNSMQHRYSEISVSLGSESESMAKGAGAFRIEVLR